MTDKQNVERLMQKVKEVRKCQIEYFKSRNPHNLTKSKIKESELDTLIKNLEKLGYQPSDHDTKPSQSNLF